MKPKTEEKDHPQDGKNICKGEYRNKLMQAALSLSLSLYIYIYIYIKMHSKKWANDLIGHFYKEGIEKVIHQMRRWSV